MVSELVHMTPTLDPILHQAYPDHILTPLYSGNQLNHLKDLVLTL